MQLFKQWIFVLYIVLLAIIDFSSTVDGLSTTNERGMYARSISYVLLFLVVYVYLSLYHRQRQMPNKWNRKKQLTMFLG